jgi:hypothetical protein
MALFDVAVWFVAAAVPRKPIHKSGEVFPLLLLMRIWQNDTNPGLWVAIDYGGEWVAIVRTQRLNYC